VSWIDYLIFGIYMAGVLAIGYYHFRRNRDQDDYYVGGRKMGAGHVGLSIVATDVGGGFSIGLGGVGFLMGLAGSWLLFTGLVGAWFSAVLIVPRIKRLEESKGFFTYPDFLRHRYGESVALVAAIVSGIGYLAFTGSQVLAGATLASETAITQVPWGMEPFQFSLWVIAVITILYTVIGGLKAVIYTDTIQWIILLFGLIFLAIPLGLHAAGGWSAVRESLPPEMFSLANIHPITFLNWMVTIIPIWLIAMTLYQRMYACRDDRTAKRAWFIAGLFEYPVMAFAGVFLGMIARVLYPELPADDAERGLPMLIHDCLPIGLTGLVIAAYFSAIMSTADSCLMASSGNFVGDVIQRHIWRGASDRSLMRLSQIATLVIGIAAVLIASRFDTVLKSIMFAYGFMVSGLFIPTLGALFWRRGSSVGALFGILAGGTLTVVLQVLILLGPDPPPGAKPEIDPTLWGILLSLVVYVGLSLAFPDRPSPTPEESARA
jgi:solute:Na+ symporter, SSS family